MGASTAAGAKFYIGTTAVDGTADTYVEVNPIVSISEFGRVYNEIKFSPLSTRAVQKFKGSYDDGGCDLSLGRDTGDVGQAALRIALDVDADYNFKYVPNDAVPAAVYTVAISIATPGLVTLANHGFVGGMALKLANGAGTLPTGLTAGTTYYVCAGVTLLTNTFALATSMANALAGTGIATTGSAGTGNTLTTVPAASQQLMKGKVLSYTTNNGTLDSVIAATAKISLKSGSIIETAKNPVA